MSAVIDRRKWIGGSDIAAILGVSPWKNAVDLWLDKIKPPVEGSDNWQAKARGKRLEPYILDMIREEHGLEIVAANQRYVDSEHDFFAAEIDAETATENIEIKTVHPFKAKEWGEHETDQLPIHYVAQAQWGLGVRGRDVCRVFALIGDDLKPYVVERDDELIEAMRWKAIDFWNAYVIPKVQPPINFDDPADAVETLKKLYPGTNGQVIKATAMHEHWRAVWQTAKDMLEKYQGVVDGAKAHILAEMGEAAAIQFDDERAFVRKQIKKKAFTVEYPASTYIDFRLGKLKETL